MELYDIRRNIILRSDIKTITNLRLVDTLSSKICHNNDFWIDKFNYDGIKLFKNNMNNFKEWVEEYNYMKNTQNNAHLILTTNIIETEVYKNVIDKNGELMDNKIRIMCDVKEVENIMSNIDDFKFDLFIKMVIDNTEIDGINLPDHHKIHNIEGHIKIELIDNKYNICYTIYKRSMNGSYYDDVNYIDICCINECKYEQIRHLLIKSMYKQIRIQDFMMNYYLYDGGSDYESNSKIVLCIINIEKDNELLELENTPSRTIMLINNIENALHQMQIKNNGKIFTFENIKHSNLITKLTELLSIDFSTIIYETIHKINPFYLHLNILIITNTRYSVKCNIRVYLDDKISYKIKIKQQYDHHIINEILTKSINLGFNILDFEGYNIYCDFLSYDNNRLSNEDVLSLNRTIMRKAIEYLL